MNFEHYYFIIFLMKLNLFIKNFSSKMKTLSCTSSCIAILLQLIPEHTSILAEPKDNKMSFFLNLFLFLLWLFQHC